MSAWTRKFPAASPAAMVPYAMAKDLARNKVVMFGGTTDEIVAANVFETWEWGGSNWAEIVTAHAPSFVGLDSFFAQGYASMAYDPVAALMVLPFPPPGANLLSTPNPYQTWTYEGIDWTLLSPAHSPSWQAVYQVAYDTVNGYVLMVNSYQFGQFSPLGDRKEVWKWDGVDWTLLWGDFSSGGTAPSFSFNSTMAYDPVRGQAIVFGGGPQSGPPQSDSTYAWDSLTLTWADLAPPTHPSFRDAGMMAYSENCGGIVMFGGSTGAGGFNETWLLPSAVDDWTLLAPSVAPSPRASVGFCPDVTAGNLVLFGGEERPSSSVAGDTWTFRCSGFAPGVPVPTLESEFRIT